MKRSRFVQLTIVAFGLVLASFVVRGTTRLLASYDLAMVLSAPLLFAGAALIAGLFVLATLDVAGIRRLE